MTRQPSLWIPYCFCFALLGCAGPESELKSGTNPGEGTTDDLLGEAGLSDGDTFVQPGEQSTGPGEMASQAAAGKVGLPCATDADCGDTALGCMVAPRQVCAVTCDEQNPCPGAPCREGFCPPCGDGICAGPELQNNDLCPGDCGAAAVEETEGRSESFTLTNPRSGAQLHGEIFFPEDAAADNPYPAVVLVPGGTGSGEGFVHMGFTSLLTDQGVIALIFDPDGRGQSGGVEDQCGADHQAGLEAMIEHLAGWPEVATGRLGVASNSFGITCATGALLTYRETTPAKFLVDVEGPANRDDTAGCDGSRVGHIDPLEHPCDDDGWWQLREASENIKGIRVPYLRIQTAKDHAQPDNDHALLMINSVTQSTYGGEGESPWTLVNDTSLNQPNAVYTAAAPPQWLASCEMQCRVDAIKMMQDQLVR